MKDSSTLNFDSKELSLKGSSQPGSNPSHPLDEPTEYALRHASPTDGYLFSLLLMLISLKKDLITTSEMLELRPKGCEKNILSIVLLNRYSWQKFQLHCLATCLQLQIQIYKGLYSSSSQFFWLWISCKYLCTFLTIYKWYFCGFFLEPFNLPLTISFVPRIMALQPISFNHL